ncbi:MULTISPECIES: hypothetical protein [unclassified Chelatococcus]|uniref:hypothetical protein n=1 Tax=unclassified Chelatococcus TaxID=2638111 RepID=UPI001BD13B72|nr:MULTISPECIES: hypothetical protein [unclassified Chelatococcus]CAH1648575.1 conserved hypothetical protein [Hyphomicrobiales bacterium]MBS7741908.1 hypothetical protein [Chelatococcus sp. HY11]MBX3541294.1 hypothetical protein [Chelatococcus sp.]MCO5074813.1 hypothetical protein [Chelatococcus sp.]CAH1691190.1 conserved hypothetical protein [Hyphomicrobiales bacterium]
MRFCHFIVFENTVPGQRMAPEDAGEIRKIVADTPALRRANIYTPESAQDIYNHEDASPQLSLQLYFDELAHLEAAIARDGHLQALVRDWPSLAGATVTQQAMALRRFPVDDPVVQAEADGQPCSYVVHYSGQAENLNAWFTHYVTHHPQIMRRFPGIREIEVLSRIDWCDALPWQRVHHIQRNRVMFDSPGALTAALQSPVRHELRADYYQFPKYEGGNAHYPMATDIIRAG